MWLIGTPISHTFCIGVYWLPIKTRSSSLIFSGWVVNSGGGAAVLVI